MLDGSDEHIAKALGRDQRGLGAAAFDQGVGKQRGGVDHPADCLGIDGFLGRELVQGRQHRSRRSVGGGQHLGIDQPAAGRVMQHQVGEGTADVNTECVSLRHFLNPLKRALA